MFIPQDRKAYDEKMAGKLYRKEDCPFCRKEFLEGQILWEGKYWQVIHNLHSYSGTADHIMAIPSAHKLFSHTLSKNELEELEDVYRFVKDYFGEKDYFSSTRETLANRSIEHFHMHFIPGKLEGKYLRKMLEGQGFPIHEDLPL